jgi:hypothetical protein
MTSNPLLPHTPYDIMVGIWIGTFATFTPKGDLVTAGASRYLIYWKKRPTLMHFQQDEDLKGSGLLGSPDEEARLEALLGDSAADAIRNLALPDYNLTVSGKHASAHGSLDVSAAETSPDVYHFDLQENGTRHRYRWLNTHILLSPNERRTIGPVLDLEGKLGLIMVHSFTRISDAVPEALRRELT